MPSSKQSRAQLRNHVFRTHKYEWIETNLCSLIIISGMDLKIAERKYKIQMGNAKRRNIEWEFTFETWAAWWKATGKWDQRGRGAKNYVMGRNSDSGPYSPSNVKCITNSENFKEFHTTEFDDKRRTILQEANKLKNLKVHTCPHCGKQSRGIGYFGFHGEKCKFKPA